MKLVVKTLYYLFIVALVGVGGLLLLTHAPLSHKLQMKIVQSGSMMPAIKVGSVVVIMPRAPYEVGEIITFTSERMDMPVTHRVFAKTKEAGRTTYVTKGDANEEPDLSSVPERNVIGKVVLTIPYLGYIIDFARKPMGFTFLIGIPATLVILDELLVITGEVRAWRRKRHITVTAASESHASVRSEHRPEVKPFMPKARNPIVQMGMDGVVISKMKIKQTRVYT
jgi:signal peptidase